jgi:hypothetical protein
MNVSKSTRLGRLIPSLSLLFFTSACVVIPPEPNTVVDSVTNVTVFTPCGTFRVRAKIDTGADGLSIDRALAKDMCLEPFIGDTTNTHCPNGQAWVTNAMGGECRDRFHFTFLLGDTYIKDRITVTDKSGQRQKLLIGNRATAGRIVVRPVSRTNTRQIEAEEEEAN